jgi:hypothetical protein
VLGVALQGIGYGKRRGFRYVAGRILVEIFIGRFSV